jgi:hypothetical protein
VTLLDLGRDIFGLNFTNETKAYSDLRVKSKFYLADQEFSGVLKLFAGQSNYF